MPTFSILTTTGKNKEAAAMANGTAIEISEIAFGDGDYAPTGGETALTNELARKPVQGSGLVNGAPNTAFFDILLEAEDGPYIIREAGLFDEDGDLIAIVKYDPPINKPVPESGQTVEALLRVHVVFSDLENLIITINAINAFISAERKVDTDDGLDGGGDLSTDRTHKLAVQSLTSITGASVEPTNDWFLLRDQSAAKHKKIRPSEMQKAIGVPVFASDQETIDGASEAKKTHPHGVAAAIAEAIQAALGNLPEGQVLALATVQETVEGLIDTKVTHPEGVAAAIAEAIGGLPPDQVLGLATVAATILGQNTTKATHAAGVKAAIDAAANNSRALNYYIGQLS